MAVSCQFTPVNVPVGGVDALGAAVGVAVAVGAGVAVGPVVGAVDATGVAVALGAAVGDGLAEGDGDADGDGDAEAEGSGDADADADAETDAEAAAAGEAPGTPATNVIVAPSDRDSVSCPFAIAYVVAVVRAWAKRGPNESSGHIASVEIPALIVMPPEPLVV